MSRSSLHRYSVALLAVAAVLPFTRLLPGRGPGASALLLAAVTLSAWQGGLGPGLLASAGAALVLHRVQLRSATVGGNWTGQVRLELFLGAAVLISILAAWQKQLEAALRRQDRRKDELLATLAHELRSPVSALLNATHLLRLAGADPEAEEHARATLERQSNVICRLVEDLLEWSRADLGKLRLHKELLDVAVVAVEAVESVRPLLDARGHRLEVSLPPAPVSLEADSTCLGRVLVNLLTNAANYTPPGGNIRLALERAGGTIVVRVRDNGVGLAPEMLSRVFEPFVQAELGSAGGLGLGLSLVRGLVELHGGSVTVSSEGVGKGSEFVVRLPEAGRPSGSLVVSTEKGEQR